MKQFVFWAAAMTVALQTHSQVSFFELSDTFFQKYVDEKGQVDYLSIKTKPQILDDLYTQIEQFDFKSGNEDFRKAFLINAYNLLVIRQVVDNYPINGPLDQEGFFDATIHFVGGQKMTLDQLEKQTLFKDFPDPRLHFVLVCAAKSCPPLANRAYFPDDLDRQLDQRTRFVMNFPGFILVSNSTVQLSQIFKWYKADFMGDKERNLLKYVNKYRDKEIKANEIGYYEYDWTLNAQKK